MDILAVGYLSIDTIRTPDHARRTPGGAALYAALGATWAGAETAIAAAIGDDFEADWLDAMAASGIDCAAIERRPGPTRRARLIHRQDGTRLSAHGEAWWERTAALSPPEPSLDGMRCCLGCPMPAPRLLRLLDQAHQAGIPVVADVSEAFAAQAPTALLALVPRLHAFAPSCEETRLLLPSLTDDEAAMALARLGPHVLQTRGADGAVAVAAGGAGLVRLPAPPVDPVVDPTGAGDATTGALSALLLRVPFIEAARAALAAGALAVSAVGPEAFGLGASRRATLVQA